MQSRMPRLNSPRAFHVWWLLLLLLHGVNAGYYATVAWLYKSFRRKYVAFQLRTFAIGLSDDHYPIISAVHAVLAAVHVVFVLLMTLGSLHAKRLVFQPTLRDTRTGPQPLATATATPPRRRTYVVRVYRAIYRQILGRRGVLGAESRYFDHTLLARELLETALQTYQLHCMTQRLSRQWLLRVYLGLLVLNCWSVPLLHRYCRSQETRRRLLCLLCDAMLDMVSSMGISSLLFGIYARQYTDPDGQGFPFARWADDSWLATMQQEFQSMLVASWGDLAMRVTLAISLLQCMDTMKDLLTPTQQPRKPTANPHTSLTKTAPTTASFTAVTVQSKLHRWLQFTVNTLGPSLFVVWGAIVLGIHIASELTLAGDSSCRLPLQPWLATRPGCALVELNCHLLQSNGSDERFAKAWLVFDPHRAARLVIRHCPQLVMSPAIAQFSNVIGIKLYNTSVIQWGHDAAVTSAAHHHLRTLYLVRTLLPRGELPAGLSHTSFPQQIKAVITCVTNLVSIPSDLDTKWPRGLTLAFEFSPLTEIPSVVIRLHPSLLSVAGSPIATVPVELLESPLLGGLLLGNTQVVALPANVTKPSPELHALKLHNTKVATFWAWMEPFITYTATYPTNLFNAFGTPYCDELKQINAGTRSQFSTVAGSHRLASIMDVSTPAKLALANRIVDCTRGSPTNFPLPYEDANHAVGTV